MDFLRTEKVVKRFANHLALNEVSINVQEGKIFGLLGPNGAGKTTLIRIINQITAPDSGTVYFKGEKLSSKHITEIGYLPEERGLYKKMKIGEQALYLCQLKGVERIEALRKLKYWFEKFEIQSWWDKKVEELSKGMQQKVQFIVTVLHQPKLLIFDEPFSGFDPINANLLKQEILFLREQGSTIIFSTHNMASVEELCDDIALINNAKTILDGSVRNIKAEYKTNSFIISFLGEISELQNNLPKQFEVQEVKQLEFHNEIKIQIKDKSTTNNLLQAIIPRCNVLSFNELIPDMNEIFIRVVGENNQ